MSDGVAPSKGAWTPQELSAVDAAFPATVEHLMPPMSEIPEEFTEWNRNNKWQKLIGDWFYSGLEIKALMPKEGIDPKKAMRHVGAILGSFEPKHEHKEAAAAYLMSLWFDDVQYETRKRVQP